MASTDFADRWRSLAKEALEVADEMTDPEAEEQMWRIALWYERLAKHAETCKGIAGTVASHERQAPMGG